MLSLIAGVLIVAAGVAYWWVSRRTEGPERGSAEPQAARRFGAVEIRLRAGACDAARALEGSRFLASEAPELPLPSCSAAKCSCHFAKLMDRRTDERRFEHGGLSASLFGEDKRQAKRDRRAARKARKRP